MAQGLLVLETPWDEDLKSPLSVGPFLQGLGASLGFTVICQRFNGKRDLVHYLEEFGRSGLLYCYIASHGTAGRLETLLENVNGNTIASACGHGRGRGFIIGACSFGNRKTATAFLSATRAAFVAGYSRDVPWGESMLTDLTFLTYVIGKRCHRRMENGRVELVTTTGGEFKLQGSQDPMKVARWVYEDFPLSRALGVAVHRRVKRAGQWRIESSDD